MIRSFTDGSMFRNSLMPTMTPTISKTVPIPTMSAVGMGNVMTMPTVTELNTMSVTKLNTMAVPTVRKLNTMTVPSVRMFTAMPVATVRKDDAMSMSIVCMSVSTMTISVSMSVITVMLHMSVSVIGHNLMDLMLVVNNIMRFMMGSMMMDWNRNMDWMGVDENVWFALGYLVYWQRNRNDRRPHQSQQGHGFLPF